MNSRRGTGAREIYSSVDQTNKVKTKRKKGLQFKNFHKFWLSSQNSCDFSRILKRGPKNKRFLSQKFYEINCKSSKITKMRAVNTNLGVLGLNLHSNSPEPVNFFGAQSSLGGGHSFRLGGTSSHLGGTAPECPPVAPGLSPLRFHIGLNLR